MSSAFDLINDIDKLSDAELIEKLQEYGSKVELKGKMNDSQRAIKRKLLKHLVTKEFRANKQNQSVMIPKKKSRGRPSLNNTMIDLPLNKILEENVQPSKKSPKKRGRPKGTNMAESELKEKISNSQRVSSPLQKKRRTSYGKDLESDQKDTSLPNVESGKKKGRPPKKVMKKDDAVVVSQIIEMETSTQVIKVSPKKVQEDVLKKRGRPKAVDSAKKRGRKKKVSESLSMETPEDDSILLDREDTSKLYSPLNTHEVKSLEVSCVDVTTGAAMAGLAVSISEDSKNSKWKTIFNGETDEEGMVSFGSNLKGTFKISFSTKEWFIKRYLSCSQPLVEVHVEKSENRGVLRVHLMLSPCSHTVVLSKPSSLHN